MSRPEPVHTRLSAFLPYQLSVASTAVSSRIAEQYRTRFGLKVPEWRIMAVLGDAGALTQRELTLAALMDKVAVNRACKVLEERGLAARKPNLQDGRSHHLELTEAGREMHSQIMPLAEALSAQVFSKFTQQELDQFRDVLVRICKSSGELDPDAIFESLDPR